MLLQTNSYIVPRDKRAEHVRLLRKFRQTLARLGCDQLEVYEQSGANWSNNEHTGRFVQIMRFRDRQHQLAVQAAERNDPAAQELISEFCELINFPYQQQQGLFTVGFYQSVLPVASPRGEAEPGLPAGPDHAQDPGPPRPSGEPESSPDSSTEASGDAESEAEAPPESAESVAEPHSEESATELRRAEPAHDAESEQTAEPADADEADAEVSETTPPGAEARR